MIPLSVARSYAPKAYDYTELTDDVRQNINKLAEAIKTKGYVVDMTEAISVAILLTYDTLSLENNDAVAEVVRARGSFSNLSERLNNLSVEDINKNLGKIDQTYLTDELIQQIAGTAPINAVPADGSITNIKLANKSVSVEKTDYLTKSKNLFNKDDIVRGGYFSNTTGEWVVNDSYVSSGKTPVKTGVKYFRNTAGQIIVFNSLDDSVIASLSNGLEMSNIHSSKDMYARLTILASDVEYTTLVEKPVSTSSTFRPEIESYNNLIVENTGFPISNIEGVSETDLRENLFDKNDVLKGGYFGHTTGEFIESEAYFSGGKIPVVKGNTYDLNQTYRLTLFNDFGIPQASTTTGTITVGNSTSDYLRITIPSNANLEILSLTEKTATGFTAKRNTLEFDEELKVVLKENLKPTMDDIETIESDNLFDKSNIIVGGFFSPTTGAWVENEEYVASGKMPVVTGKKYFRNTTGQITVFNAADDSFIGNSSSGVIELGSVHASKKMYARLSVSIADIDFTTFVERPNTTVNTFKPTFKPFGKPDYISNNHKFDDEAGYYSEILGLSETAYNKSRRLYLPDFSGYDQPFHPSVVYIEHGFKGYKYWMVQSPYPPNGVPSNQRWEVPVVYKSNDGLNWLIVANPLDDLNEAEIANKDYMSDNHIVYRKDLNRIEVWYRLTHLGDQVETSTTHLLRKYTTNGETWSSRETLETFTNTTSADFVRSPSIIWDETISKYRRWKQNNAGVFYQESSDGLTWTTNQELNFDVTNDYWHIDVAKYDDGKHQYHFLGYSQLGAVDYYYSDDGLNFKRHSTVLSVANDNDFNYKNMLYRSISLKDENGFIRLYNAGYDGNNLAGVSVKVAKDWDSMRYDTIYNQTIVKTRTNETENIALGIEMSKTNYK